MNRHSFELTYANLLELKQKILRACAQHQYSAFLDSNNYPDAYGNYDWIAAYGAQQVIAPRIERFTKLKDWHHNNEDWLFGHLSYDLKNDLEDLSTRHSDFVGFKQFSFFNPTTVIFCKKGKITVESVEHSNSADFVKSLPELAVTEVYKSKPELKPNISPEEYQKDVGEVLKHIQHGNIYELNYCMEFSATCESINGVSIFNKLNDSAKAPFAAYYKNEDQLLLCASPERYIQKQNNRIISQPIKGTAKRAKNPVEDEALKRELVHSQKERSENVMICDLVRNDLSKTAAKGSVTVPELFGVHTFQTVHHLISTVQSTLQKGTHFTDVLASTFPMGSMTGAPKIKAMQLIDQYEHFSRGLYSGAVGYISPQGDFDFNVVIRSLLFNSTTGFLTARVGSAITVQCDPKQEYEECLLKASNLLRCLED